MSHARVLIVDDDCDFADSLAETLDQKGHQVSVAYSGEDALIKPFDPEILLDEVQHLMAAR